MRPWFLFIAWMVYLSCGANGYSQEKPKFEAAGLKFFESKIRPVFIQHCYECHSSKGGELKGGLSVESRAALLKGGDSGAAIVPFKPAESWLMAAIEYSDDFYQMPPKSKLPKEVVAVFKKWIEMGAPDPRQVAESSDTSPRVIDFEQSRKFWAFRTPQRPALPPVKNQTWVSNAIDTFILSELERSELIPAIAADRRTLLRRVTFDLTGLPPTVAEINAFLADTSPLAYENLVERLLASPRYGERWGRKWLDVARYADSNGLDENLAYVNAFRYRDYVVRAWNQDLSFANFLQQQLAGDLLDPQQDASAQERIDRLTATGFLSIGPKMLACDDGQKMEMDIIDEQLDTMSRAFMGLTMGCARCHDHKFDPIPSKDYYALASIFKSTKTMENFKVVAKWHEYPLETPETKAALAKHKSEVKQLDDELAAIQKEARQTLRESQQRLLSKYLIAASKFVSVNSKPIADGHNVIGNFIRDGIAVENSIVWEAEKFQRGTLEAETTNYGKDIGVLLHQGYAEYDIDIEVAGDYQLELRYAAVDSRPMVLSINGTVVDSDVAAHITGTWFADSQTWFVEGIFELQAGKNVIRLAREDGPVPHVDKILLVKAAPTSSLEDLSAVLADTPVAEVDGLLLQEAEEYARGSIGKIPPIVQNTSGTTTFLNYAEYDFEITVAGNYRLEWLYTQAESRGGKLFVDGHLVDADAANAITGSFQSSEVKWFVGGVFQFAVGKHTLRWQRLGTTPHFDKIALIPTPDNVTYHSGGDQKSLAEIEDVAVAQGLQAKYLRQWVDFLLMAVSQRDEHLAGLLLRDRGDQQAAFAQLGKAAEQQLVNILSAGSSTATGDTTSKLEDKGVVQWVVSKALAADGPFRGPQELDKWIPEKSQQAIAAIVKSQAKLAKTQPVVGKAMGVTEGKVEDLAIHVRGNYLTLGEATQRGFLEVVDQVSDVSIPAETSGRLQLAQWLIDAKHPLTSRVFVNRLWLWHFGKGLQRSPDNFGLLGQRPTNQPLLDWLAVEFIEQGWSIKQMHRLMLLSSTYQMSSTFDARANTKDPENRLWWRYNRRRLDAEEVRDALLAVGNNIDLQMYGQLLPSADRAYVTGTGSKRSTYDYNRRSVYLPILRSALYNVFIAFDFADPSVIQGQRQNTVVTPQALFMMNSKLVQDEARRLAQRVLQDDSETNADRINTLHEILYGRVATLEDVDKCNQFLQRYRKLSAKEKDDDVRAADLVVWQGLCRVLLAANEFAYLD
ncbi:MAG: DUF1553 domain-containing protein [Planctomycetaceae bacterium]|nr:DUF1553 domain-containing protein [Planctomycetaceae bacterium]MBT4726526.1 DUF1553 domain-containing protein [Planctomycetaceae bacterium]MBT5597533.1 DUF1553 domain-containing protein [Planctomycetaceae bacterium]MBT5885901.1 DUF1553 domain-containing protein [Planctomycetaceae bacterium]MBT7254574.1 DUF1553 domain-containing protein [Planctomycetaceae bacterium]